LERFVVGPGFLGKRLISYERNDFARIISYLELAHQIVPEYRGIGKILGYSYGQVNSIRHYPY
jgi:hypothetical protein